MRKRIKKSIPNGNVTLNDDEIYKRLDSLFRFYSSEISAHSGMLGAWILALAVYSYWVVDKLGKDMTRWYALAIFFFFLLPFGLYSIGRLIYYSQLSLVVQNFMGLTSHSKSYSKIYQDLMEQELKGNGGVANIVADFLSNRIRYYIGIHVYEEKQNFMDAIKIYPISKKKAYLIIISNFHQGRYCRIIKAVINAVYSSRF